MFFHAAEKILNVSDFFQVLTKLIDVLDNSIIK